MSTDLFAELEQLVEGLRGKAAVARNPISAGYQDGGAAFEAAADELEELIRHHENLRPLAELMSFQRDEDRRYHKAELEALRPGLREWQFGTIRLEWHGHRTKTLNVPPTQMEGIVAVLTAGNRVDREAQLERPADGPAHEGHWAMGPGNRRVFFYREQSGRLVFNTHPISVGDGGYYDWRAMLKLKGIDPNTFTCLMEG